MPIEQEPEAIIYLRTSTDEQTPELQLNDVRTIAKPNSLILTETESGWKDTGKRKKLELITTLIKQRKLKDLYVWDLDRLFRNRKKLIDFFKFSKVYGCSVHSFRQMWLEDLSKIPAPFNEMMYDLMLQVMGWLAEEESSKKSQRIKSAIRIKENATYSYKGNKWGRKPISTFKTNRIIELNQQGLSLRKIAEEVNLSLGGVHKTLKKIKQENASQ